MRIRLRFEATGRDALDVVAAGRRIATAALPEGADVHIEYGEVRPQHEVVAGDGSVTVTSWKTQCSATADVEEHEDDQDECGHGGSYGGGL